MEARRVVACVTASGFAGLGAILLHVAGGRLGTAGFVLPLLAAWMVGAAARRAYGPAGWLPVLVSLTVAHLAAGIAPLVPIVRSGSVASLQDPVGLFAAMVAFAIADPIMVLAGGGAPAVVDVLQPLLAGWTARPVSHVENVTRQSPSCDGSGEPRRPASGDAATSDRDLA